MGDPIKPGDCVQFIGGAQLMWVGSLGSTRDVDLATCYFVRRGESDEGCEVGSIVLPVVLLQPANFTSPSEDPRA
jgi:hypothetical protein